MDRDKQPTRDQGPPRRRGGHELPDKVQDRPEQNAGYDAVVHRRDEGVEDAEQADITADPTARRPLEDLDDPAE